MEPLPLLAFSVALEREGERWFGTYSKAPELGQWLYCRTSYLTLGLGSSLIGGPVGLLAWIYEKLHNWMDKYPWEDDRVLTWISIYWFLLAASLRIWSTDHLNPISIPKNPNVFSRFPNELTVLLEARIHQDNRIVADFEHDGGGRFAACEKPGKLVTDLCRMFGKGHAYGVIPGKHGFT